MDFISLNLVSVQFCIIIVTLAIIVNIAYSTIQLGISPMPSTKAARTIMVQWAYKYVQDMSLSTPSTKPVAIAELGAGWGGLARQLARQLNQFDSKSTPQSKSIQVIAYEQALCPWLYCCMLQTIAPIKNLEFRKQNFLAQDLTAFSLYLTYLYPQGMQAIAKQRQRQQIQATPLISCAFALPNETLIKKHILQDWLNTPVYWYEGVICQPSANNGLS